MYNETPSAIAYLWLALKYRYIRIMHSLGFRLSLRTEDRHILENTILPYIAQSDKYQTIVFVGCDWYTSKYKKYFKRKDYWTIEIDPAMTRYGAKRHIIDSVSNLEKHFAPGSVDAVICNGVFGFGLNEPRDVEQAFSAIYSRLRINGLLVFGWNNLPRHKPFPVEQISSLEKFRPYVFPALGTDMLMINNSHQHIFNFYSR